MVEVPGATGQRIAVERAVAARAWVLARSPAEADVLAVCGHPGPQMREAIARVWEQLPGPRTRVDVVVPEKADAALDAASSALLQEAPHREDARSRTDAGAQEHDTDHEESGHGDTDHEESGHGDMDDGDMDHGDMDHGDMDHGDMDHGDMDHGDMDMPMPGGIGLASGRRDRDGLEMDVLHVPLGPVLPHWPAGLVLTCTLQGDVVVEAGAELLDPGEDLGGPGTGDPRRDVLVARCDAVARLLAVAGWDSAADQATRVRDRCLDGVPLAECAAAVERLARRVTRSRSLRWSLRGSSIPTGPGGLEGVELLDRVLDWLEQARVAGQAPAGPAELGGEVTGEGTGEGVTRWGAERVSLEALSDLVSGLDLAAVRLVVAGVAVVGEKQVADA
ncbi:hypothetical protein [Kineococcus arenarius]|uniref:hypothetical protein n=1 Tax=unclassified Kineococcus TaxID=2621656 RepID=UPI003D7EA8D6